MVECDLPTVETRVRFPSPAPLSSSTLVCRWYLTLLAPEMCWNDLPQRIESADNDLEQN